jgi:hypothetical protein
VPYGFIVGIVAGAIGAFMLASFIPVVIGLVLGALVDRMRGATVDGGGD